MLKLLHYISFRVSKKSLLKSIPVYIAAIFIYLMFGVSGLVTTFFLILSFFFGWVVHSTVSWIKDYRLTLRLNRVHYNQADYETLRRENKALLQAVQARMDNGGRGARQGGVPASSPPPTAARLNSNDLEEMKLRYEQEEKQEYDRDTNGSTRDG